MDKWLDADENQVQALNLELTWSSIALLGLLCDFWELCDKIMVQMGLISLPYETVITY